MKRQDGFSLIELLMVVGIMLILAVLLLPVLGLARRTANESSAVATLKSIAGSEVAYASRNQQRFAGSLSTLSNAGYLDSRFAGASAINGYLYSNGNTVGAAIPGSVPTQPPEGFVYSAAPSPGGGDYNYAIASDGVPYYGSQAPTGLATKPVASSQ